MDKSHQQNETMAGVQLYRVPSSRGNISEQLQLDFIFNGQMGNPKMIDIHDHYE